MHKKCNDGFLSMFCVLVPVGLFIIFMIYVIFQSKDSSEKRYEAEKAACVKLDPKYGRKYTTTKGPYAYAKMTAVRFTNTTVGLQLDMIKDTELAWFRCDSLIDSN